MVYGSPAVTVSALRALPSCSRLQTLIAVWRRPIRAPQSDRGCGTLFLNTYWCRALGLSTRLRSGSERGAEGTLWPFSPQAIWPWRPFTGSTEYYYREPSLTEYEV